MQTCTREAVNTMSTNYNYKLLEEARQRTECELEEIKRVKEGLHSGRSGLPNSIEDILKQMPELVA
jgi:hypothetical protein